MFDLFHIAVALCPLAAYLLLIGFIRCRSRPLVVSGGRDLATFAIGISGFIAVGPMELFFPRAAASIFGSKVWFLLALLYLLCVLLVILASRPRLVVYGVKLDELQCLLRELLPTMDLKVNWLGENIQAPELGISALVESAGPGNVCQIVAVSHRQNLGGWLLLERALVQQLQNKTAEHRLGALYLTYGLLISGLATAALLFDPQATAQTMRDMLRY